MWGWRSEKKKKGRGEGASRSLRHSVPLLDLIQSRFVPQEDREGKIKERETNPLCLCRNT